MDNKNTGLPPWPMYRSLLWVIDKLDNLLKKIMPAEMRLLKAVSGHGITQIVSAALDLGIFDCIGSGGKTLEQLSAELSLDRGALFRLMRGLLFIEVIEKSDDVYYLTKTGMKLVSQGSLRNQSKIMSSYWMDAFSRLPDSVRSGEKTLHPNYVGDFFEYLKTNKEAALLFDSAMEELTYSYIPAIHGDYDFSSYKHVVDIGGGTGIFLNSILAKYPNTKATLFDIPSVVDKVVPQHGDRCGVVAGDFFSSVPEGGDLYILKFILHDWSDAKAKVILGNCRKVMAPGSKLLLLEYTIDREAEKKFMRIYVDLLMLTMFDGKERSLDDLALMLRETGFTMNNAITTRSPVTIIEAVAV